MESCGTAVSITLAILVLQLGLVTILAQQNELQTGVAGQAVTLNCRGIPHDKSVTWNYYNKVIIKLYTGASLKGKAAMSDRSAINRQSNQLTVSYLKLSDAGIYTCEYGSHTVSISLHVFQLTISLDGHFLPNEVLELTLLQNAPHPLPHLNITVFTSNNTAVRPEVLQDVTHEKYRLKLKKLEAMDNGIWMCHIHSDSPLINQNIPFDVKVLGFQNPDFGKKYATVDGPVVLTWHLNFQKIKWKKGFTGQLNWKQENATTRELLDFNVTAQGEKHETKKSSHLFSEVPKSKADRIEVKLPKVHFSQTGRYQCQLVYNRRYAQSEIQLVVMKVSANLVGPLARGAQMTLTCQVSSPLPPNAHLLWERVNGTDEDSKKSEEHEVKVEVNVSAPGLWNCHLVEDNDRKISSNYLVEAAPVWTSYVVIGASIGGSLLMFGLACLCIINGVNRQRRRQRAKRMAQARQYLLENKTCQCQHRLNK